DAQNTITSDMVPAGTTFVSFTQNSGPANGGTLPAGGTETFTLVVHANPNDANGSTITNTAFVSTTTADTNSANNMTSFNSVVATSADLAIAKSGPATADAGSDVTYT